MVQIKYALGAVKGASCSYIDIRTPKEIGAKMLIVATTALIILHHVLLTAPISPTP